MTSNDNFVTVEIFNTEMGKIEKHFIQVENLIEKNTNELKTAIKINAVDNAHLQTSVYWGFAIATVVISIVIAVVGFMITLAPTFLEYFTGLRKTRIDEERIQEMIDLSISKALSNIGK